MIRRILLAVLLAGLAILAAPARRNPGEVVPWQGTFLRVAGPRWIDRAAQVQAESGFDPRVVSPVGAMGPAQFMPTTWREWAPPGADPFDPEIALPAQHRLMNWLEARVGGDLDMALGGYNAGLGNIRKAARLAASLGMAGSDAWVRALPQVTGHHARETQGYLVANRRNRARIRSLMEQR